MSPAPVTSPRDVSSLDVLKFVAVGLMIVDHVGLYLLDEGNWLRVLGRPAAVIFGFLIGFSSSRRVPATWVGLGLALTLLDHWLDPDSEERALDILISLALTRIAVPAFERIHRVHPMMLVPTGVVLALLATPLNAYIEYGTEVMLVALLGVAVRLNDGLPVQRNGRDAVALVAMIGMSLIAIWHFEFQGWQAAGCTALLAVTIVALTRFRRTTFSAPAIVAPVLRFIGRNTLWIYAVHVALLQIAGWWIGDSPDEG